MGQTKQWRKITLADRVWSSRGQMMMLYLIGGVIMRLSGKSWDRIFIVLGLVFIFTIVIAFTLELFISEAICPCGEKVNLNEEGFCRNCGEKVPPDLY